MAARPPAETPRQASHLSCLPDLGANREPQAHAFSAIRIARPGPPPPSLLRLSTSRLFAWEHLCEHVFFGNTLVKKVWPQAAQRRLQGGSPGSPGSESRWPRPLSTRVPIPMPPMARGAPPAPIHWFHWWRGNPARGRPPNPTAD